MKSLHGLSRLVLAGAALLLVSGCLLRHAPASPRRFILSPLPPSSATPFRAMNLPVAIGLVKMPPYLMRSPLALRKGTNEIDYLEGALWAEPLDQGFQRILAINLSRLLPSEQVLLPAGEREQVKVRLFINVEQFDVDTRGRAVFTASWRITHVGNPKPAKSGQEQLVRNGPPPGDEPQLIVAALSELTSEFSRILATALRAEASSK